DNPQYHDGGQNYYYIGQSVFHGVGQGGGYLEPPEYQLGPNKQGGQYNAYKPAQGSNQQSLDKIDTPKFLDRRSQVKKSYGILLLVQDHHNYGPDHVEQGNDK